MQKPIIVRGHAYHDPELARLAEIAVDVGLEMAFNPAHVFSGPGTLYAAPLGTTEPTSVTGGWPAGWVALGYTNQGSEFDDTPTFQQIKVEEEVYAIRNVLTDKKSTLTFVLSELTEQNLALALNGGITSVVSGVETVNGDGSLSVQPPAPGLEGRVMLGWDSIPKAGSSGTALNVFGRLVLRQCIQTGAVKMVHRKGSNVATIACQFELEVPSGGLEPWSAIFPASQAA